MTSGDLVTEEKTITIGLDLKGKLKNQFKEIKEHLGVESNTEALRFLINRYYRLNIAGGGA